jgi:hypothetical protein
VSNRKARRRLGLGPLLRVGCDEIHPRGLVDLGRALGESSRQITGTGCRRIDVDGQLDHADSGSLAQRQRSHRTARLLRVIAFGKAGDEVRQLLRSRDEAALAPVLQLASHAGGVGAGGVTLQKGGVGGGRADRSRRGELRGLEHHLDLAAMVALREFALERLQGLEGGLPLEAQIGDPLARPLSVLRVGVFAQEPVIGGRRVQRLRLLPARGAGDDEAGQQRCRQNR